MANTTNFGWETPDDTDLVKDGAAAMRTLGNAIDASLVDLKGGTTGQVLSKNTNTDMDFTWVTTDDANAIQNAIVDAKGDLIAASAADTPARLAVGANGETLVADSSASTGLRWQGNYAAGKNKIINGDFRINQRGFSSRTTNGYGFDRLDFIFSGGTVTYSAQTFTAGAAPVAGYEAINFARLVTASQSGNGDYALLQQKIEDVRTLANQTVTLSFWAKASTGTPNIGICLEQQFGSGGSSVVIIGSQVAAITSSWARYSFNITVPSISGKTIGTGSFLNVMVFSSAGTSISGSGYPAVGLQNVTIDTWGWQLEAGSVATAFQTATGTLAGELQAAQRYYYRNTAAEAFATFGTGFAISTTQAYFSIQHPVTMRVAPSSVDYATLECLVTGGAPAVTNLVLTASGQGRNASLLTVTTGGTFTGTNSSTILRASNSTAAHLGFNAEL